MIDPWVTRPMAEADWNAYRKTTAGAFEELRAQANVLGRALAYRIGLTPGTLPMAQAGWQRDVRWLERAAVAYYVAAWLAVIWRMIAE